MLKNSRLTLNPDYPIEDGQFSFEIYARLMSEAVQTHESEEALVIGVHGRWGTGKTTLLKMVKKLLPDDNCIFVEFNPWRFTKEESLWRALILSIIAKLRELSEQGYFKDKTKQEEISRLLNETEKALYTAFVREEKGNIEFDYGGAAKQGLKLALRFTPWGSVGEWAEKIFTQKDEKGEAIEGTFTEEDIDSLWGLFKRDVIRSEIQKIESIEQFIKSCEKLIQASLNNTSRLVVLIDDLDRCLPDKAIEIFEAIKLFLDFPKCTYLVALDREVVQKGLDIRYQQDQSTRNAISGDDYIEKMMGLSFSIPPLSSDNAKSFLQTLDKSPIDANFHDIVLKGVAQNLRKLKRFANMLAFQLAAYRELNRSSEQATALEPQFVKLQCIAFTWKGFFQIISEFPWTIIRLQYACQKVISDRQVSGMGEEAPTILAKLKERDEQLFIQVPALEQELSDVRLVNFLASEPQFDQHFDDTILLALLNHIVLDTNKQS